jgi:hypothetical protein
MDKALPVQSRMTALKTELTDLQNQQEATCAEMWDQVKRVRNGIKGIYGDPSARLRQSGQARNMR